MCRAATTLIAVFLLTRFPASGQDVPPPPRPKDDGPSLEVTMKRWPTALPRLWRTLSSCAAGETRTHSEKQEGADSSDLSATAVDE
jgi:hypothetical protein